MRIPSLVAIAALCLSAADLTPAQQKLNADSFEYAWKTIRDKMWEPMPNGLDWQKVHDELLPKAREAKSMEEARNVMRDMISRLKMSHFNIVPADVYDTVGAKAQGDGNPGFDVRILDGAPVVTTVEASSPAAKAGIRPGWQLLSMDGKPVEPVIRKILSVYPDNTVRELLLTRAVLAGLSGAQGQTIKAEFLDGSGQRRSVDLELTAPRGAETKFGFLPTQHVFFETRKLSGAQYIHFNMFMDPARIATQFADAVQSCMKCDGIIIDLRGNPGGLGGMSMGMAGWFISKPDQQLGVMKMKDNELKFVANPRPETFDGPLVILTDGLTGSTSEIFAGGMKDLGRARIVGTRSAGAALPSLFERLPNGDGFQYAVANYISQGGKPLEGIGVIPDEEVKLTRKALLDGHDPVVDAALAWIGKNKKKD
jgi:carboxyl-terminal processing protease